MLEDYESATCYATLFLVPILGLLGLTSANVCRWPRNWANLGPSVQRNVTASITSMAPERGFNVSDCSYLVYSDGFLSLINTSSLKTLASRDYNFAHEAGVYVPALDAVFFTSNRYVFFVMLSISPHLYDFVNISSDSLLKDFSIHKIAYLVGRNFFYSLFILCVCISYLHLL